MAASTPKNARWASCNEDLTRHLPSSKVRTIAVYVLCGALALLPPPIQSVSRIDAAAGRTLASPDAETDVAAISTSVRAIEEREPRGTAK